MCTTTRKWPGGHLATSITPTTWCTRSGPVDHLDHASYQQFWGGKIGVDATAKLATEGYTRGWPEMISQDPAIIERVTARWKEYGLS